MYAHLSRLTICAAVLLLTGCGGSDKASSSATPAATEAPPSTVLIQPGAPGEPAKRITVTPTPEGAKDYVEADVAFANDMIHHHNQALVMTGWVADRTGSTTVRLLAKRMEVSQKDEVDFMKRWLETRGQTVEEHAHDAKMPGMLNQEQLDALQAAQGKKFDQLFLAYMTQHHEGALQMVSQLWADGGGAETELNQFAMHVDSDQAIEIKRMAELAAKL